MKKNFLGFTILTGSMLLVGCGQDSLSKEIAFEPSSLANCEIASEVLVKWDVRSTYPGVQNVQILVTDGISQSVFAEGGSMGETKTGPWVRPGMPLFIIKDKANGKVLGEGVVKGPKCQ